MVGSTSGNEDELLRTPEQDEMEYENVEQLRREVEHLGNELKRTAVQEPLTGTVADLDSFEPEVLREYAERRIRARTRSATAVGHRATTRGTGDTGALGLFYQCPGRQRQDDVAFACSIGDKTFKDVVPTAAEEIGRLRFDTVFSLARLISINDHERCVERKRLLMLDPKHVFVTSSGVRKAFLFFKKCCDHVFRSLATHDGSFLALLHDGGTGLPIEQLNEANNEGVRYARANDWDDIAASEAAPKKLIIVPDSFSLMDTFFKTHPTVSCRIYRDLNEIGSILDRSRASFCVLIGPTSDRPFPKKDWCKLASSLAAAARNDTKLLAVAPPRGDDAYEQNRTDINEAFELARSVAVLAKHNIVSCIPAIESGREPSHGPGAKPRTSTSEKYSKKVLLDYFDSLSSYLKGEVDIPPLEEKTSRSARTRRYFKERKAGRIAKNPRPDRLFRNNNQAFAMAVQPQMYPMPPQGQYVMVPTTSSYPPRTFSARGRGHQNRRRF